MNRNMGWTQWLWLCSPSPRREIHSEWDKLARMGRKTPSVQYLSLGVGVGGAWGHNCSLLLAARGGVESVPPPPCLVLSKRMWWWKWWCVTSKPCKLLLSSPGPGDPQTRMKDLGRQRPGFPSPSGWPQRRSQERRQRAPPGALSQPTGYWDTQTVAFKPGNGQHWLNNWFLPHFRKVANCEGTQLYQTLKYNYT